jgi:hypothetical protein
MKRDELIDKTDIVINRLFRRVAIKEPEYTMLRELQADIIRFKERKAIATEMKEAGSTIREIATALGYKHPGSVTHLLNNQPNE